MKTLFLQSVDDSVFAEPRRCVVLQKLRSGKQRGILEVELDPPLDGRFHGLLRPGISKVAIASRHSPDGFAPDDAFPPSVYVCRMLAEPDWLGRIDPSMLQPLSWAEVFKTLDAARKRTDPIVLSFPTVRYPSWKFSMKEKTGLSWRLLVFGFKKGFLPFDQLASYADDPENGLPDDTRKDLFRQIISLCSVTDFQHCCAFADTLVRYDDFRKTVPSESELSACWTFVIFDWAHGLDFPAWHRLALADEIAEEFGWPVTLAGFSRKEGFPPEDEARRMAAWQTWLNDERERWRPKHSEKEVSK